MTAVELYATLRRLGATLTAEGGRLRYRMPRAAASTELKSALAQHRDALLAMVQAQPTPRVRLFFCSEDGRPCPPDDPKNPCWMWTYERAPRWFYTAEVPIPSFALEMWAGSKDRCPNCAERRLTLSWQRFANGTMHLRCDCGVCGAFIDYIKPPPKNPDVEFRAAPSPEEGAP